MTTQYIRKNDYEAVEFDGEWIVLNTDNFTVTKLNEVGGFCWSLLHRAQTVHSLVQAIREEYTFVSDTFAQDMEYFLSNLIDCGLVQHAG